MTHKHFTEAEAEAFADQRGGEFMHASGTWRLTPEALHAAMEAAADAAMLKCRNDWGLAVEKAYQLGEAAAQAALAKQGEPVAWQSIETAPKDGTPILVLDTYTYRNDPNKTPHHIHRSVYWHDESGWVIHEDGEILDEDSLTHWMPLPPAPGDTTPQPAAQDKLREALQFYADGLHFTMHDKDAWDTVSGEPQNFWEDENNTATVEDGSIARAALTNKEAS